MSSTPTTEQKDPLDELKQRWVETKGGFDEFWNQSDKKNPFAVPALEATLKRMSKIAAEWAGVDKSLKIDKFSLGDANNYIKLCREKIDKVKK